MKSYRRLEGLVRGFSNHRRIQILEFLERHPETSVEDISDLLRVNFKTISGHLKRLAIAGLIVKGMRGKLVFHKLSPRGQMVLGWLKALEPA